MIRTVSHLQRFRHPARNDAPEVDATVKSLPITTSTLALHCARAMQRISTAFASWNSLNCPVTRVSAILIPTYPVGLQAGVFAWVKDQLPAHLPEHFCVVRKKLAPVRVVRSMNETANSPPAIGDPRAFPMSNSSCTPFFALPSEEMNVK